MTDLATIPPRSGTAFLLGEGQLLTVIDPEGSQVADLVAFAQDDVLEAISNGRTFDYEETIRLTKGNFSVVEPFQSLTRKSFQMTWARMTSFLRHAAAQPFVTSIPTNPSILDALAIWPPRSAHSGSRPMRFLAPSTFS